MTIGVMIVQGFIWTDLFRDAHNLEVISHSEFDKLYVE